MAVKGEGDRVLSRRLALPEEDDQALCLFTTTSPSSNDDPNLFLASTELGWLCRYDLREGGNKEKQQAAWKQRLSESSEASSVVVHPKDPRRIFVSLDSEVYEFDERKLDCATLVSTSSEEINQVVVHPSGEYLASADDSGEVTVVRLSDKKPFKHLRRGHQNICSCLAFRPRQPWEVFSGGLDCLLLLWDFCSGKKKLECKAEVNAGSESSQLFNPPFIHSLAVPTYRAWSNHVAAGRGDGKVAIYEVAKMQVKNSFVLDYSVGTSGQAGTVKPQQQGHTASIGHVCFTGFNDEKQLLSGGNDGKVILWDWQRAKDLQQTRGTQQKKHLKQQRTVKSSSSSTTSSSDEVDQSVVAWSHKHGHKVNWTATVNKGSENIIIADTSNQVSIYSAM